jgi:hypothetical protein
MILQKVKIIYHFILDLTPNELNSVKCNYINSGYRYATKNDYILDELETSLCECFLTRDTSTCDYHIQKNQLDVKRIIIPCHICHSCMGEYMDHVIIDTFVNDIERKIACFVQI